MEKEKSLKLKLELLWWGVTALIAAGVLFPLREILGSYPFLISNLLGIVFFLTFTRYIFQLQHSFIGKSQVIKMILLLLCMPIFFYFIGSINDFQTTLDENGLEAILGPEPIANKIKLGSYTRTEFIFFAVGSVIATVVFAIRLIISIWRYRNKGTI